VNIAQIGATEVGSTLHQNWGVYLLVPLKIELNWHEPEFNAALVDHYLLLISELHPTTDVPIAETELRVETVNKNARITLLEPGTSRFRSDADGFEPFTKCGLCRIFGESNCPGNGGDPAAAEEKCK
jgi:hypothetical protein